MKKQNKICKILEVLGIVILIFSFICNQLELIPFTLIIVIALIGLLLCIPENVIFYKAQMKKEEEIANYWKYKVLALPLCIIGLLIGLIYAIYN